jgi:small subunit ribosomal protein S1
MKALNTDENASNLEKMYEQSFSGMGSFKPGQAVKTEVVSVSKDSVFLQLNGKSEGILDRDELTDKEGNLTVKVGDQLRVFFLKAENGEMRFTTRISGDTAGAGMLEEAYHEKIPVEGLVEKEIKGGYDIRIGAYRAFCPYSKMGEKRSDNPAEYIGKRLSFKIQEYKDNGRSILVSNRVIHEEARQERLEALKQTLQEGMVITGAIASIQSFGAFVDLGGIQALLPVSEISRSRVEDIHSLLSVGQEIFHPADRLAERAHYPQHEEPPRRSLETCEGKVPGGVEAYRQGRSPGRFRGLRIPGTWYRRSRAQLGTQKGQQLWH